jgi:NAD(P)-dependent dehydrogenase (short-subunit alcohol dehydrogenase family)
VTIDVTDASSVAAAAETASGVSLLINNAGSFTGASFLDGSMDDIRLEMDTHYFDTLNVTRAFAPQLAAGGGAVLNVLSILSWITFPGYGAYAAAKSAEWSLTNARRAELSAQGTLVSALHVGYMDTDMARQHPELVPSAQRELALAKDLPPLKLGKIAEWTAPRGAILSSEQGAYSGDLPEHAARPFFEPGCLREVQAGLQRHSSPSHATPRVYSPHLVAASRRSRLVQRV